MFELTRRADYALRLMIDVGAHDGATVSTADVARCEEIPYQFLRKVAGDLVTAGMLKAGRGVKGGVSLARPPESITALDIVMAIDPPAINQCTIDPSQCDRRDFCAAYPVWMKVQQELERVLKGIRLSDLIRRHKAQLAVRARSVGRAAARPHTKRPLG
jgi:Rrf2 family protein